MFLDFIDIFGEKVLRFKIIIKGKKKKSQWQEKRAKQRMK